MTLSDIRRVYLVGIKGTGVSSIAQILVAHGISVSGSDTEEYFFTEELLKKVHISFFESFSADHITGREDVVIYSTAYSLEKHPELIEAKKRGIAIMSYPEFLGMLVREKLSIAVCGSHGKTTTTALLAHTLQTVGLDPSAIVGSRVNGWDGGALNGNGVHFVFEADEYQNKLALYQPWSAILTNIDYDHPDFFPTSESYRETFRSFLERIPSHGFLVVCGDDTEAVKTAKESGRRFVTYGFSENSLDSEFIIYDLQSTNQLTQSFKIKRGSEILGEFEISLTGRHNVQNAGGVVAMCYLLKCTMARVAEGLRTFEGTARRFEKVGEQNGVLFFDDYAHHPSEIQALLNGVRMRYPHKRIFAIFQPHTFSRTKAFFEEFSQCFSTVDKVYLLDIYTSAREREGDISSKQLVDRINRYDSGRAEFLGSIENAVKIVKKEMKRNDIVLTIGAGDVWKVNAHILQST